MAQSEFKLIQNYFSKQPVQRLDTILGIGDDAAIIDIPENKQLLVTTDTLVSGVHFLQTTSAENIAHKALAVNLSDLAAMGAEPAWVTLVLALPEINEAWIEQFCLGFNTLAKSFSVQLIGGDISYSPTLTVTVQAMGMVEKNGAIRRATAQAGDLIFVTGHLGGAGYALELLKNGLKPSSALLNCLERPEPKIKVGLALRGIASSMIDISDGLTADLGHILEASKVGAMLQLEKLPIHPLVQKECSAQHAQELALSFGDDYELCFTVPQENLEQLKKSEILKDCICIGSITESQEYVLQKIDGTIINLREQKLGYEHFSE